MNQHILNRTSARVVLILAVIFPTLLPAQSLWQQQTRRRALALEILKPEFERVNSTFPTALLFLSVRSPIKSAAFFVAELPFSYFGVEYRSFFNGNVRASENAFGNPYLG